LLKKLRDQAKQFQQSSKNRNAYDDVCSANPDLTCTEIQRDLNTTRISSVQNLLKSSVRVKQSLSIFYATTGNESPPLGVDDWKFAKEAEGILNMAKHLCTLAQNEHLHNAAYGPVAKKKLHNHLSQSSLLLIDADNWRVDQKDPPRIRVDVATFTAAGKTCLRRALLETERRFFGNRTEVVFTEIPKLKLSDREKGVLVLDKRTCLNGTIISQAQWRDAVNALESVYVGFYVQCKLYDRQEASVENIVVPENMDGVNAEALAEPVAFDDNADIIDLFADEDEVHETIQKSLVTYH